LFTASTSRTTEVEDEALAFPEDWMLEVELQEKKSMEDSTKILIHFSFMELVFIS